MRHILCTIILAIVVLFFLLTCTNAEGDYQYEMLDSGTVRITGYTGNETELSIPNTLDGYKVTEIGQLSFARQESITSVTIPSGVTDIGYAAFISCTALTSVIFPDSVNAIGDLAFVNTAIEELMLPISIKDMGFNPYGGCTHLHKIVVAPDHPYLESIDNVLFSKPDRRLICYPNSLVSEFYSVPEGTIIIGDYAFAMNSSLSEIILPNSVTEIRRAAFGECSNLEKIVIPDSVKSIEYDVFANCPNLSFYLAKDSYSEEYCNNHGIPYEYYYFEPTQSYKPKAESESLPFISMGDLWNLTWDEIKMIYPGCVLHLEKTIQVYSTVATGPKDSYRDYCNEIVPLGLTKKDKYNDDCDILLVLHSRIGNAIPTIGFYNGDALLATPVADLVFEESKQLWQGIEENIGLNYGKSQSATINQDSVIIKYGMNNWGYMYKGETVTYLGTINTQSEQWDLIEYGGFPGGSGFVPHGCLDISIPFSDCHIEIKKRGYPFTQKAVKPEIVITYNGTVLQENTDYEVISDDYLPGNAAAIINGRGYFTGSATVNFIISDTQMFMREISDTVINEHGFVNVVISVTKDGNMDENVPNCDTVKWSVDHNQQHVTWEKTTLVMIPDQEKDIYSFTCEFSICEPGEYELTATYGELVVSKQFFVEPRLTISAGPLLPNGTLAETRSRQEINSYTDVRIEADASNESLPFLRKFMSDLEIEWGGETFALKELGKKVIIYDVSMENENGEETTTRKIALAYRIASALPENELKSCNLSATILTNAKQELSSQFSIRNGIMPILTYRSDGQRGEEDNQSSISAPGETPKKPSVSAHHTFYYNDNYFYESSYSYHHSLAVISLGIEMSSFSTPYSDVFYTSPSPSVKREENLKDALNELGFIDAEYYGYNTPLNIADDKAAFGIALKYISSEDTDDTLIAVIIRGGGYGAEWASNFNVGNTGNHNGFQPAANAVFEVTKSYISKLMNDGRIIGDVKIWMTGFSRAGAVANLAGHMLNEGLGIEGLSVASSNCYVYTFATPAGYRGSRSRDNNIYNIISDNDFVPKLALNAWGFSRYGTDIVLPTITADSVSDAYVIYTGEPLGLNNLKGIEDSVIDGFAAIYPDTASFSFVCERCIFLFEKNSYQSINGDFLPAFLQGLFYGLLGDVGGTFQEGNLIKKAEVFLALYQDFYHFLSGDVLGILRPVNSTVPLKAEQLADDLNTIWNNTAISFSTDEKAFATPIERAINDGALTFIASYIVDNAQMDSSEETKYNISRAHYPEHYLAWLETGGNQKIISSDQFAQLNAETRKEIGEWLLQAIFGE